MPSEKEKASPPGVRKAALLLLSLGEEEATKVLRHLDDSLLELVIFEMSKIKQVPLEEKAQVLKEFHSTLQGMSDTTGGGPETARNLLEKSIGKEKANVILKKIGKVEAKNDFEFLNSIEAGPLHSMLSSESPQIIAVTLSNLDPKKAAEVLKHFPKSEQSQIALRLATTSKTHPDVIQNIARILKKRYEERDKAEYSEAGGAQVLANILNFMEKGIEEHILQELDSNSPDVASQVRDQLYTFEDLLQLDAREMRVLIHSVGDDEVFSLAIRGAQDILKAHILQNMSANRSRDILERIDHKPRVTLREINEARSRIVQIARRLEEENKIIFKKNKEEYIE